MSLPLEASLLGLRESVYARTDHAPQSSATVETFVNRFVNQAVQRLALDVPYAFHEEFVRFTTDYEFASTDSSDTLSYYTFTDIVGEPRYDEWVLVRTNGELLPYDRTLDGAHIELTDSRGVVHTNQIRTVWMEDGSPDKTYISLVKPFIARQDRDTLNSDTDLGPFTYRIFRPYVWLPDDFVQIKNMRVTGRGDGPIQVINQDQAERLGLDDYNYNQTGGRPTWAYRRGHFQLPAPSTAATVETATSAGLTKKWRGPEPYGSFQYCWTITWGKRDYDHANAGPGVITRAHQNGTTGVYLETQNNAYGTSTSTTQVWVENRRREPIFESAPSPPTETFTIADPGATNQTDAAVITFPNLSYQLGFMFTGDSSAGAISSIADSHSGLHIRIYRRRVSTEIGAGYATLDTESDSQKITSLKMLDDDDSFNLLAEFRIDKNNAGQFVDDGFIVPDRSRRLRDIHGYQAIRLHPVPDDRYEIEARVVKRPALLINDSDRPPCDPVCAEAIVLYAASLEYERMGNPTSADRMLKLYREALQVIGRRYGDMRPAGQPDRLLPASARRRRGPGGYRAGPIR